MEIELQGTRYSHAELYKIAQSDDVSLVIRALETQLHFHDNYVKLLLANAYSKEAGSNVFDRAKSEKLFEELIEDSFTDAIPYFIAFLRTTYFNYLDLLSRVHQYSLIGNPMAQYHLYLKAKDENRVQEANDHLTLAADYGHLFAQRDRIDQLIAQSGAIKAALLWVRKLRLIARALRIVRRNESDPRIR
jgi:hypothetical protein